MSDLDMVHKMMEFDDSIIIEHGIVLVSYLNGEERETGWVVVGDPSIDQTIGLMAVGIHRIDHHTGVQDGR